jgi:DNA processing protein
LAERGLLDFFILRLKELNLKEKIILCESLEDEPDFLGKSKSDFEYLLNRKLKESFNMEEIRRQAEEDAEKTRKRKINWTSWHNAEYPPLLREIYDPPVMLFYKGPLPNQQKPLAAIVGTRKPSPQGAAQAFDIAKGLGHGGVSVVSGLAMGIDSMAHRGNIEGGAATVAVLGCGVDQIYPSSNRNLARQALETGGVLLSEYPAGTGPRKWTFPARNRIISGISRGILIVEAPKKSGALITANFALEQNRELWVSSIGGVAEGAVGGTIDEKRQGFFDRRGTFKLAEEGAGIIHNATDILKEWNIGNNREE